MSDYRYGHFVWRECMTHDVAAAQAFYQAVFNWSATAMPMPGMGFDYHMHGVGEQMQGGMVALDPNDPNTEHVPPHWMPYVSVPDVAATAALAVEAGGKVAVGPMDIGVGIFAVIGDPQGGWITAWHSKDGDGEIVPPTQHGAFCWDQLNTTDVDAAIAFYTKVFGWTTGAFAGMTTFEAGGQAISHVSATLPGMPTHWLSSVVITQLGDTLGTVEAHGGKVLMSGMPIPGVGTVGAFADPQGAVLAVLEPEARG